jgi:hypothetical protein
VWLQTPESKEARFCLIWERENTFGRPCRAFPVRKKCLADSAEPFWGGKKVSGRPCRAFPQLQKAKKIRKNKEQDNETEI